MALVECADQVCARATARACAHAPARVCLHFLFARTCAHVCARVCPRVHAVCPPGSVAALICGTSTCHMVPTAGRVPVPGVWGPYYSVMQPGAWLLEAGQSAAGAALDRVLGMCGATAALLRG